ncbi:MAG: carbohydrate ABC transporter permease [Eubacteriales bacterium]|nr:carbohydrate ABC transporter permease [Eubacteriales bacterium]
MGDKGVTKTQRKKLSPVIIAIYVLLVVLAVIYIAPLLWMLSVSLKDNAEVMSAPFSLPKAMQFANYAEAWTLGKLGKALVNSVLVCGVTLIVSMFFGAMAAFAIGRMRWKLSEGMHTFFLIGMMVPVHCILIPLFVRFAKLGLTNSRFGLMLPYITFSLPMTIFLLTGFFRSMPGELFEAAAIDGCGIYRCFFKIALPLCRTGFFVSGLMTFVNNWNELLLAMVFISDPEKKTLPVTLTYFVGPYATNYVQMFAAIIIAIAPTVIVYCMFSNQIVEGLTTGAVKG